MIPLTVSKKALNSFTTLRWHSGGTYPLVQGSATFWTSGPHSVLASFQQAATILANQKRKVFTKNSGLVFGRTDGEDKKKSSPKI